MRARAGEEISHVPDNAVLDFELGWRCAHINNLLRHETPQWGRSWWVCSGCYVSNPWRLPALGGCAQVDRKTAFWEYGEMKTTLDLPDKLMRDVKIRAVHEHKKLKDVIAELLQSALGTGKPRRPNLPKPVKLRGGFIPTAKDIEAAIAEGRD